MGTRSLTHVKEGRTTICTMYRQMDGYPTGHGQALADFLKARKIINGISMGCNETNSANGMGCLAAQMVAHFKGGIGGIYLEKPGRKADWEDYEYTVTVKDGVLHLKCQEVKGPVLFSGSAQLFNGSELEGSA